jgi:hypothetical protein
MRYFVRGDQAEGAGSDSVLLWTDPDLDPIWGDLYSVAEGDILLITDLPLAHKTAAQFGGVVVEWDEGA